MTPLLVVLGVLVGVAGIVLLAGFASPRVARMSRSVEIAAPAGRVFPYLNNLRNFVDHWSPWTEKDPGARHEYNEVPEGKGARYVWEGHPKKVGSGSMEIRESEPGSRVKTYLQFKGRGDAFATWTLEDRGGEQVRVTWDFECDNGMNPLSRLFGRLIERFLAPDYEKGLAKLKEICERPA